MNRIRVFISIFMVIIFSTSTLTAEDSKVDTKIFNNLVKGLINYSESVHAGRFEYNYQIYMAPKAKNRGDAERLFMEELKNQSEILTQAVKSDEITEIESQNLLQSIEQKKNQFIEDTLNSTLVQTNSTKNTVFGYHHFLSETEEENGEVTYVSVSPSGRMVWKRQPQTSSQQSNNMDSRAQWLPDARLSRKNMEFFYHEYVIEDLNKLKPSKLLQIGNIIKASLISISPTIKLDYKEIYIEFDLEKNVPLFLSITHNHELTKQDITYYYSDEKQPTFPIQLERSVLERKGTNQEWNLTSNLICTVLSSDFKTVIEPIDLVIDFPDSVEIYNMKNEFTVVER